MDDITHHLSSLEALLFIHGEPITRKKIGAVLGMEPAEVPALLERYATELAAGDRGLALLLDNEKAQLVTKASHAKLLETFIKEEMAEDLTAASLETLAIIAYFGPISRARIEYVRGVNSSFILRSLLIRGLIERIPDSEKALAYLYAPSFDLLKHLGVENRRHLPDFDLYKELLQKFEASPGEDFARGASSETGPIASAQ